MFLFPKYLRLLLSLYMEIIKNPIDYLHRYITFRRKFLTNFPKYYPLKIVIIKL